MMFCGLVRKRQPVEYADFSHRNLREVPADLYEHRRSLQRLYLGVNLLTAVPKGLNRLESLSELDLSENNILFLPPTIGQLTKLKILNISKNNLPNIPEAIQNCEELVSLNVTGNPIGRLCNGICHLSQLRHLFANDCELGTIPIQIERLSKLETLELRENHLITLPESLSQLRQLGRLDIGCNEFESLPPSIGELDSLEELWVDMNLLVSLPAEIGCLRNLMFLELSDNRLMFLPDTFGHLKSLTDLYLQNNMLSELPESFGHLQSLNVCQLSINRLIGLPDSIQGLTNLTDLNLLQNHIIYIPPGVGGLKSLYTLTLDDNRLEVLPKEIGNCTLLSVLTLRNNRLTDLPSSITKLSNLSILNVVGNRLSRLPPGIVSMPKIIAIWLAENQSRPLLDFQVQTDTNTGENYLTCFVFPQQGMEVPYDDSRASSLVSLPTLQQPEHTSQSVPTSSVNFDPQTQTGEKKGISRDLTPFPKELHTKIKQWRTTRDALENESNDTLSTNIQPRPHPPAKKKISRPRSLIKALSNPVQDGSGLLDASNSRASSLSPDLLINLPTAELTSLYSKQDVTHYDTDHDTESELGGSVVSRSKSPADMRSKSPADLRSKSHTPDLVPLPIMNSNNNNNNNNNTVVYSTIQPTGPPTTVTNNIIPSSISSVQYITPFSKPYNNSCNMTGYPSTAPSSYTPPLSIPPPNVPLPPLPHSSSPLKTKTINTQQRQEYNNIERYPPMIEKRPITAITNGFVHDPNWYQTSTTPSPTHHPTLLLPPLNELDVKSDGEDYDHLVENDKDLPSSPSSHPITSPGQSSLPSPEHKTSLSPILSPRTVPPQPQRLPNNNNNNQPIDLSSLSPILRTSYSSKIHRRNENNFVALSPHYSSFHARHYSEPLDSVFFPSSPSHPQLNTTNTNNNTNGLNTPYNKRSISHNRLAHNSEREFAVEHTLQSCQKPQVIKSTSYTPPPPRGVLKPYYMSNEGFLNRRPRAFTNDSQTSSYGTSISTSGRNTPDTPRLNFKSVGSVSSSGNDSGVELLRRAPVYALPRSVSNSTSISCDGSTTGATYEVTLKKNPTLGLGITGGKDGENAIKPGDKGFYVFRLVSNLPASKCGKITIGDKILAVNGVDTSNLSNDQLVKLLTTSEIYVTLLFAKEPSITLL